MCPHPKHLDYVQAVQDLVHEAVLDVDPSGNGARQVAHEPFVGRRSLVRVVTKDLQEALGLGLEAGRLEFLGVFLGLGGEDQSSTHQFSLRLHQPMGVLRPFRIDTRIPGMDRR